MKFSHITIDGYRIGFYAEQAGVKAPGRTRAEAEKHLVAKLLIVGVNRALKKAGRK